VTGLGFKKEPVELTEKMQRQTKLYLALKLNAQTKRVSIQSNIWNFDARIGNMRN
jgi:hypothetical protein